MTSYPGRIDLVPIAFKSFIEGQSLKADRYILWLSRVEFKGEKKPEELGLEQVIKLGVEIFWCDEDSKIHIRHNSLKNWPNDYNFIIDEDIQYPKNYTGEMMNAAFRHPNCVINYFRIFEFFNGYTMHDLPGFFSPSIHNKFNGGLSLFPPNTFPQSAFKYESVRDMICPLHDETWVNLFLTYEGGKVYGLHKKHWGAFPPLHSEKKHANLNETHSKKRNGEKYSFDVIQFNRVLYVFPQLLKLYKKKVFYLYWFRDKDEINKFKEYQIIHNI